jgi:cardiolipin hydrolase
MLKGSLYTLTAIVFSQVVFKLFSYLRKHRDKKREIESKNKHEIMEAYFFPDKDVACKMHFLGESQCFKENCKYSHGTTSLSELYRYLNSCRKSMDVCVYVMASVELAGIVLSMHKRGVSVRVITDDEQEKIAGSQIWSLRKAGIVVRTDTRPTSCITSLSSLMARSS